MPVVIGYILFGSALGQKLPIINGMASYLPRPEYSEELKNLCASGKVEVEVQVNEHGPVVTAKKRTGDDLLIESAITAAKSARF